MKRTLFTIALLVITLGILAQATQPCVVKQYNQKKQKTPLAGVQVEVRGAQSATSAGNGSLTLRFATLKPGDRVPFRTATKAGFELMNKTAVEQWNISRDQKPFEIVLIQSAYFNKLKGNLKQSSVDSYHEKYEKARTILEKLQKEGKLKEQEYYQKLNELEDRFDNQLKNLDKYVDQFARIDLSELSEQEQQFVELVHVGRLDEAAEAYNSLNAAGKYVTAVENVRRLNEDIAKLEDEKAHQQEAAKEFFAVLQRQVNTLKLAGGEENYKKAGELLKRAAMADTTNIEAVLAYAEFAIFQCDYKDAERFYLICLNWSGDNLYFKSEFLNVLGNINLDLHNYDKAEKYYLKALELKTQLFSENPDAYRAPLSSTQHNLGNLYSDIHAFDKSEDYYHKALENCTQLYSQNPEVYREQLASTQHSLGGLYDDIDDYANAGKYYLLAVENYVQLVAKDPDSYRNGLALTQNSLGGIYYKNSEYEKSLDYTIQALENYSKLFAKNPDAYRSVLAMTQNNLGNLYKELDDEEKAEEYFFKALENRTLLFTQNPDAYREDLASSQINIAGLYYQLCDYLVAEEYAVKALQNYTLLFNKTPDAYRSDLASTQKNLMLIYKKLKDWDKYYEMLDKALNNYEVLSTMESKYSFELRYRYGLEAARLRELKE